MTSCPAPWSASPWLPSARPCLLHRGGWAMLLPSSHLLCHSTWAPSPSLMLQSSLREHCRIHCWPRMPARAKGAPQRQERPAAQQTALQAESPSVTPGSACSKRGCCRAGPLGGPCSAPWGITTPKSSVITGWQGGLRAVIPNCSLPLSLGHSPGLDPAPASHWRLWPGADHGPSSLT